MLLVKHGAPTGTDRRHIHEGIEEIRWVATLKPTTIGVLAFRDAVREYLEIGVLSVTLYVVPRSALADPSATRRPVPALLRLDRHSAGPARARLTGNFVLSTSREQTARRRDALSEYAQLEAAITHLRTITAKEKQVSKQVECNLAMKRAEAAHATALARL